MSGDLLELVRRGDEPRTSVELAAELGVSDRQARRLVAVAVETGALERVARLDGDRAVVAYAPAADQVEAGDAETREDRISGSENGEPSPTPTDGAKAPAGPPDGGEGLASGVLAEAESRPEHVERLQETLDRIEAADESAAAAREEQRQVDAADPIFGDLFAAAGEDDGRRATPAELAEALAIGDAGKARAARLTKDPMIGTGRTFDEIGRLLTPAEQAEQPAEVRAGRGEVVLRESRRLELGIQDPRDLERQAAQREAEREAERALAYDSNRAFIQRQRRRDATPAGEFSTPWLQERFGQVPVTVRRSGSGHGPTTTWMPDGRGGPPRRVG